MAPWKVLKVAAIGIGLLVLVGAVLSLVATVIGLVWAAVVAAATLLVLGGALYVVARGIRWLRRRGTSGGVTAGSAPEPSVDDLVEQYVDGGLTEDELEHRLDRVLDRPGPDEIDRDRQLVRERQ